MKRVLFIQYTNPGGYPPLQHSSKIFADAGWEVLFLGTGAMGSGKLELPTLPGITVKRMAFQAAGWRQKLHYVVFSAWALWTVVLWRPGLVYASDSFSCPVSWLFTWLPGLKVFYHEHDSPPIGSTNSTFQSFISIARTWLARRADLCILPNEARLKRFAFDVGPVRRAVCVWNCAAFGEVVGRPRSQAIAPFWVHYHGSIVPARLPRAVLAALPLVPDFVGLRIVGYETIGSQGYVEELRQYAQELGVGHRIEFMDAIPRTELLLNTAQSDIGLSLMPMTSDDLNCQMMTGASNKPFDYLACGLPLLVSDLPEWNRMFVEPGYACACDPTRPESIAAAIRSLIECPEKMRAMGELGRQKSLSLWNYESVFEPVMRCLSIGDSTAKKSANEDVCLQDAQ